MIGLVPRSPRSPRSVIFGVGLGVLGAGRAFAQDAPQPADNTPLVIPAPVPDSAAAAPSASPVVPPPPPSVSAPLAPPPPDEGPRVLSATPYPSASPGSVAGVAPGTRVPFPGLARWRTGRTLYGVSTVFSVVGTGMVVSGIVVAAAYSDQLGQGLVYGGTASHTLSFVLSASGLGLQHRAVEDAGIPYGRSMFGFGTAFNVVGMLGVGTSYLLGGTNLVPEEHRTAAVLATSLTGSVLMTVGSILYFVDARRMKRLVTQFGTF